LRHTRLFIRISANYNVRKSDDVILLDAPCILTLPLVGGVRFSAYTFKQTFSGGVVTINAQPGELLDGQPTFTLTNQYQYVTIASDGFRWLLLENN
jgi:hypothetical protein